MTKVSILKILTNARVLLEKGWCQGSYAQINGKTVQASNKFATHYDLLGALHKAAGKAVVWDENIWDYFPDEVAKNPGLWNDAKKRTQAQVVGAVASAIAKAQEAEDEG